MAPGYPLPTRECHPLRNGVSANERLELGILPSQLPALRTWIIFAMAEVDEAHLSVLSDGNHVHATPCRP
jgi:hypothetical protein